MLAMKNKMVLWFLPNPMRIIFLKKGISNVVSTLLLVLLTLVIVGVVWGFVETFVNDTVEEDCFDLYGKFSINQEYTCYNVSTNELEFALRVGDLDVSSSLVSFTSNGESTSVEIFKKSQFVRHIRFGNGNYGDSISLPQKNEGRSYAYNTAADVFGRVSQLEIAPMIGESQCETSDTMREIPSCLG